jgi:hypothetical protein
MNSCLLNESNLSAYITTKFWQFRCLKVGMNSFKSKWNLWDMLILCFNRIILVSFKGSKQCWKVVLDRKLLLFHQESIHLLSNLCTPIWVHCPIIFQNVGIFVESKKLKMTLSFLNESMFGWFRLPMIRVKLF